LAAFLAAFFFFFAMELAPSTRAPNTHHPPDPWDAQARGSGDASPTECRWFPTTPSRVTRTL
jgi:hypothetical protein